VKTINNPLFFLFSVNYGKSGSMRRVGIVAIVFLSFLFVLTSSASATGITVCPSGCDYVTIQNAVGNASAGDTISIGAGIYTEQVYVDKSLNIIGSSPDEVTINMPDSGIVSYDWNSGNKPLIGVDTATGVNISGLKLNSTGHDTGSYSGIHFWQSSGNISNCIIYGFQDGIISNHVWDTSYPTHVDIANNQIYSCPLGCNGITCTEIDTDALIEGNIIIGVATSNIGIQIGYGALGDIISNSVYNFTGDGTGIMLSGGVDNSRILNNIVENCTSGIFLYNDINYGYDGENNTNISYNNVSNSVYGIVVEGKTYNTEIHHNIIADSSLYSGYSEALSVNATLNFWGSATPNTSKISGNITYYPFCLNAGCSLNIDNETKEFTGNTTDFSNITDWSDVTLKLDAGEGTIEWGNNVDLTTSNLQFDNYIEISHRRISLNAPMMPELDHPATLTFKNAGYTDISHLSLKRNGITCPNDICSNKRIEGNSVLVDVNQMSDYWLEDSVLGSMPSITGQLVVSLGFGIMGLFAVLTLIYVSYEQDPETFIKIMVSILIIVLAIVAVWQGLVI